MSGAFRAIFDGARHSAGAVVAALVLSGCAGLFPQSAALREAPPAGIPARAELAGVPFFPQEDYQCGPAALATVLTHAQQPVTPQELAEKVYLPARQGSLQVEMLAAPRRYGLVSYPLAPRFDDLLAELAQGNPVIVLQNQGIWPIDKWHYAVAVGYDLDAGELVLRSGATQRQVLPFPVHEYAWKKSGYWAMVAVPPGRIPASAGETRWLAAVAALERLGDAGAARAGYAAALERWPSSTGAAVGLANIHYARGEPARAAALLREAARRDPDSVPVLNNLAQALSDMGDQAQALALVERALARGGPFAKDVQQTRELILARIAGRE